ncbi:methylenetetrahydrofolate reductase [Pseudochrobactrum asaccharolyticum]|uniref:Methylenetetrahydrofolate reductase n=1 Tax=Pseudochrobactrum asaccharolyticum TaxID=354351 RepID=A0A366DMF0_9HYPH|nr:methylenetetrahydrofolate reductase [Pseudochrobactrum asaccharolyticum]RBO91241.1 methylenetetrahydrofolate reductase (NADPH) [Pseudochrobactrum asaccharolyticum]
MDHVTSVHQQQGVIQLPCLPYTLEITGKAIGEIVAAQQVIPQGTAINIAFLGNENHAQRIHAAKTIRDCGFEPVPIISSRRLLSVEDRDQLLSNLIKEAAPKRFLLVGGDPAQPAGPFQDSLSLLNSKIVESFGIRHVAITGYPEGHPKIDQKELWRCLKWKLDYLRQAECSVEITTQFGFDAQAIVRWIERLRSEGIDTPVRVGIPGPADAAKLLRFAKQFGVVASASIMRRYGLSLANLMRRSVADRYWEDLNALLLKQDLGQVYFHLYPFGGVAESVTWMNEQLRQRSS